MKWTAADIPDQTGRIAVVTGANVGLGYHTSLELARKGAEVVMACRNQAKGEAARQDIQLAAPNASLEVLPLDLASLASIETFARSFLEKYDRLDLLINNAGLMATPYSQTADGFELQFGTNHLGHFALTGYLIERLIRTPGSRVVTVTSLGEKFGKINFQDLQQERAYGRWSAYSNSKLANLLFAYELQRRLEKRDSSTLSVAAHPGFAATNLRTRQMGKDQPLSLRVLLWFYELPAQPVEMGVLPQLYAATGEGVQGGEYYGPGSLIEFSGYPRRVRSSRRAHDPLTARQLWEVSEELTGVKYTI